MPLSWIPNVIIVSLLLTVAPPFLNAQAPRPEPLGLRPDAPTYAKHGPCWVGAREFVIKTTEGRTLAATLWYPALNPKGLKEVNTVTMNNAPFGDPDLTFNGHALADAAPDPAGGPYPLVVFSHGAAPGTRADYIPCMEHWASHGFAVLALDHGNFEQYRVTDLKSALDFAQQLTSSADALAKLIDTNREAAAGFSLGGQTALRVGGARFTGLSGEARDQRVKALILMAPTPNVDNLDLSEVTLPVLVLVGSKDDKDKRLSHVEHGYQALPATRKSLVTLVGGTHKIFLDPFLKTFYPELDFGTLSADRAQDLIHHFTTAFLLDVMKNNSEAHKALLPEAVKFEEVQYATTWK
jgi:predicted dienelactone hydrolase